MKMKEKVGRRMTIVEDDSSSSEEIQADQPPVKENKANEIKHSSNDAEKFAESQNENDTNTEASTENTNSSFEVVKVSEPEDVKINKVFKPVKEAKLPQNVQLIKYKADGLLRLFCKFCNGVQIYSKKKNNNK